MLRPIGLRIAVAAFCTMVFAGRGEHPSEASAVYASTARSDPSPTAPDTPEITGLRQQLATDPHDADAHYALGLALRRIGRPHEALVHFEAAIQFGSQKQERVIDLGVAYADVSRFRDAEAQYRRVLEVAPHNPTALENLGSLAFLRGDMASAIDLYRQSLAAEPKNLVAHYRLAHACKFVGRSEEAYGEYNRVLAIQPASAAMDVSGGPIERP